MKLLVLLLVLGISLLAQTKRPVEEFSTAAGIVKITLIQHASLMLEAEGQIIYVDPAQGTYDGLPRADLILITHSHGDHYSPNLIAKLRKPGAALLAPESVAHSAGGTAIHAGDTREFGKWSITTVAAYNIKHGPSPGQLFHPRGQGVGYVLAYGGKRFYIAGDTEGIPEMAALRDIDVAFLPVNLPYTMTVDEAAAAARSFKPAVLYPYHYRGSDLAALQKALAGSGIDVRIRNWYY
jgi:L-ascorbate metabolism protein UlaG (beta-lactamase superfamily)